MTDGAGRSVRAEIDIAASPDVVWATLADLPRYPEWNPFTPRIDGKLALGADLVLHVRLVPGKRQKTQRQHIVALEAPRKIVWETTFAGRASLHAMRTQELLPLDGGGTRYVSEDRFTGILVPLVMAIYRGDMERGFAAMAAALKARAEQRR